jgi:hypothetical protein
MMLKMVVFNNQSLIVANKEANAWLASVNYFIEAVTVTRGEEFGSWSYTIFYWDHEDR